MRLVYPILMVVLLLAGCGKGNDDLAQPPERGTDVPTASFVWTYVHHEMLLPSPPDNCKLPENFNVSANGTWNWDWCESKRDGRLTDSELVEINDRISAVQQAGFINEQCAEIAYSGHVQLQVVFKPGDTHVLHDISRSGSCYQANSGKVTQLEETIAKLRAKYAGFTIDPAAVSLTSEPRLPTHNRH